MAQFVKLKYAESDTFAPGGGVGNVEIANVTVKAANIAFEKEVALHYQEADGTWSERGLTWLQNFGDYDLFGGNFNFVTNQFVIRYTEGTQTFWDNNNFANYHVTSATPNVAGGNIVLNKATAMQGTQAGGGFVFTTSWIEGEIYVNNLSFNKHVGIRFTANNWQTTHDTSASYAGVAPVATGLSHVEIWKFKTPEFNLDQSAPDFRLAVFYADLDSGESFWDNNFGRDYRLGKSNLATIQ